MIVQLLRQAGKSNRKSQKEDTKKPTKSQITGKDKHNKQNLAAIVKDYEKRDNKKTNEDD
ncbi:hypothetical protein HI914_03548 [Erysiphe necator]|nr:hypothetical protein HI914_03548 [Erysiphe necator]